MLYIPRLIISKTPVWFDVQDESLETVEFTARPTYWPHEIQGAALFILDFGYPIDAATLKTHKIASGTIGPFVYLHGVDEQSMIRQTISIPNRRIKRIGIQLWKAQTECMLEDISLSSQGGKLTSPHACIDTVITGDLHDTFPNIPPHAASVGLNLLTRDAGCGLTCHIICSHWLRSMDKFQERHPRSDVGRTNGHCEGEGGAAIPITVFHTMLAMLKIPPTIELYFQRVGDKSRNMVRKAERLGYRYTPVDPDQYLDDIVTIRTSEPMRQGRPIPEYFRIKPRNMLYAHFKSTSCGYHGEEFYGVFKDNTLVAYATLFFFGQLAQVDQILGHKDHRNDGVMNLLVYEMVRSLLQKKPWVKAINYLYPDLARNSGGIGLFKASVGFEPMAVIVTNSDKDLTAQFDRETPKGHEVQQGAPETDAARSDAATYKKLIRDTAPVLMTDSKASRDEAIDVLVTMFKKETGSPPAILVYFPTTNSFDVPIHGIDARIIVIIGDLTVEHYIDFLSAGMKKLTNKLPVGTYVVTDFIRHAGSQMLRSSAKHALASPALAVRERNVQLLEYVRKRFKETDISVENIRNGFKGSDFLIKACVDYPCTDPEVGFDSVVLMAKVRSRSTISPDQEMTSIGERSQSRGA